MSLMSWYESSIITDLSLVSISTDRIYLFCFGIVVVFSSWRWISKLLGSILTFSLHGEEKSSGGDASMISHKEPYVWLFYVVCKLWLEPYFAFSVHHGQYNESDWIFNVSLPSDFTAWRQNLCAIGLKLLKKVIDFGFTSTVYVLHGIIRPSLKIELHEYVYV